MAFLKHFPPELAVATGFGGVERMLRYLEGLRGGNGKLSQLRMNPVAMFDSPSTQES